MYKNLFFLFYGTRDINLGPDMIGTLYQLSYSRIKLS
jgi:hypothetical protein